MSIAPATIAVEDLTPGTALDLAGDPHVVTCGHEVCPDPGEHESLAAMVAAQYAVVDSVVRETPECVVVFFEDIDAIGFPLGHRVPVAD